MRKNFSFDKESGITICEVSQKGISAIGKAKVHPEDKRFATELVGMQIAEFRAIRSFLEKRASKKRKEARRLQAVAQSLLASAEDDTVEATEICLIENEYIQTKEEFYDKIRSPKERVRWEKLEDSQLSESFKSNFNNTKIIDAEILE